MALATGWLGAAVPLLLICISAIFPGRAWGQSPNVDRHAAVYDTARERIVHPIVPRKGITLGIDVRGLDFHSRVLGSPSEVPLGASFMVVVTPDSNVHIERGTLFYRKAGTADPFDSVPLTPLATDFIAAVPATAVTEDGVDSYVRVENSGFASTHPPGDQGA